MFTKSKMCFYVRLLPIIEDFVNFHILQCFPTSLVLFHITLPNILSPLTVLSWFQVVPSDDLPTSTALDSYGFNFNLSPDICFSNATG